MSRELPILFNTEMVKAIAGQINPKTATRRVIKGFTPDDALWGYTAFTPEGRISCRGTFADGYGEKFFKLPCRTGDILYVRETWNFVYEMDGNDRFMEDTGHYVYYAEDPMPFAHWTDSGTGEHKDHMPWRPSIHMPKEAARIWLKVTEVRAERLKDITHVDIIMEGVMPEYLNSRSGEKTREDFIRLWNSTVKKSELEIYGWNANPWVWVIEFERCEKPAALGRG